MYFHALYLVTLSVQNALISAFLGGLLSTRIHPAAPPPMLLFPLPFPPGAKMPAAREAAANPGKRQKCKMWAMIRVLADCVLSRARPKMWAESEFWLIVYLTARDPKCGLKTSFQLIAYLASRTAQNVG